VESGAARVVRIRWRRYTNYEDAQNCNGVVYLFEGKGRPYYWGKADQSCFGGNKRPLGYVTACGRYGTSYDHLVTAFMMLGGRLYIGKPAMPEGVTLDDVEDSLIAKYPPHIPAKPPKPRFNLRVLNVGSKPACLPYAYLSSVDTI
jgi:hypothetical protein